MDSYNVFQDIFDTIETPFLDSVTGLVASFHQYAATPIRIALVIYVAGTGFAMMAGRGNSGGQWLSRSLKLALVAWFATDESAYSTWVQQFFLTGLSNDITQPVIGATSGQMPSAWMFYAIWSSAWQAGLVVWRMTGFGDIGEQAVIVLFWLAAMGSCVLAFTLWLMSHMVLGLFVIVGKLLVGLVLFRVTEAIFYRWIGAMISCVLLQIGVVIMLALTVKIEGHLVGQVLQYTGPNVYAQLKLLGSGIIVFAFCGVIIWNMREWANTLSAGMHAHGGVAALLLVTQSQRAAAVIGRGLGAMDRTVGGGLAAARQQIGPAVASSLSGAPTPAHTRNLLNRAGS